MNNGNIYELVNVDVINNLNSRKKKNIIFKAIYSFPQYYISVTNKYSDETICALVYTKKRNKSITIKDSSGNKYWVRYDYFTPLPNECLNKTNINLNNPYDIVHIIYQKHKEHLEHKNKADEEYKAKKRAKRKAYKDNRKQMKKSGLTRGVLCAMNSMASKPRRIKYNNNPRDEWNMKHPCSAGRGDF